MYDVDDDETLFYLNPKSYCRFPERKCSECKYGKCVKEKKE